MLSKEEEEEKKESCLERLKNRCLMDKKEMTEDSDIALGIFSRKNGFRELVIRVSKSNKFENFILLTIMVSSIALTVEHPLNDPEGTTVFLLKSCDYVTTSIFVVEAVVRIVAAGFLLNGPQSYLRNVSNILDFVIVVPSLISFLPITMDFKIVKIIRMVRLLRPLRFIGKNENLRISI